MKLHYFAQVAPDADDLLLADAIAAGKVPRGCLLGGVVASSLIAIDRKPCKSCSGPRERCGGDPREDDDDRAAAIEQLREIIGDGKLISEMNAFFKASDDGTG